jgi:hypothetical protein
VLRAEHLPMPICFDDKKAFLLQLEMFLAGAGITSTEKTHPQARAGEARDREDTIDVAIQPKIRRCNTKGLNKLVQYGFTLDTFPKKSAKMVIFKNTYYCRCKNAKIQNNLFYLLTIDASRNKIKNSSPNLIFLMRQRLFLGYFYQRPIFVRCRPKI